MLKTTAKRLQGVLLALLLLFVSYIGMPAKALAEEAAQAEAIEAYAEANDFSQGNTLAYSPLVGEMAEERDESVKVFRRADGAQEAVVYSEPIHYLNGEVWETIDNTLELVAENGSQVYRNKANDFKVSFSPSFQTENLITVEAKGHVLSWGFIQDIPEGAYETLPITDTAAEIQERAQTEPETDEERDMQLRFPEKLTSEIAYIDPSTGLNIHYVLSGKSLSEQIVLAAAPETAAAYTSLLKTNGLRIEQKDGRTLLQDTSGESIFEILPAVMYDANGEESEDVEVRIAETEDGYSYTLIPSESWLKDASRAYPVTVDPDVRPTFNGSVDDTYISSTSPGSNYNTRDRLKIGGTACYRSLIKISGLPTLKTGDVVVEATLNLSRYNTSTEFYKEIDLYKVLTDWNFNTVTWNSFQPDSTSSVERGRIRSITKTTVQDAFNEFDITDLVKFWYANPDENFGMILESWNEPAHWYTEYRSSDYNSAYSGHPYFSIFYVNSTGLESRFTYHSQSAGRAGTGSVNDFSGNLTWTHTDATIVNGALPITLTHVYNTNARSANIGYGYGWRLNYAQSLKKVSLVNRTGTTTYYRWIDGDRTEHYYKYSSANTYVNELDKDSTLTFSGTTATITDKGGNKLIFTYDTGEEYGRLTTVQDANGNKTVITYVSPAITNLRISAISEELSGQTNGQQLTLSYADVNGTSMLSKVTSPDGLDVEYSYTSAGNLKEIEYKDHLTSTFSYSSHCLTKAKNVDDYNLNYTYSDSTPYKVIKAEEKADTTEGQYLTFDYGWNCTTVTDQQGNKTIYQFNNAGQAVSVRDPKGRAVYAAYNTEDQTVTQLSAASKLQSTIFNLLKNHSFETTTGSGNPWTRSNTTNATYSSAYAHTGKYSLKMVSTSSASISATQTVTVTEGKAYTFSAYFSGHSGAKLSVLNGSTEIAYSEPVSTSGSTGSSWTRGVVTFTVPTGVTSVKLKILLPSSSAGTVYVDSAQLETGSVPNRYNMIENGDFSDGITAWTESSHISASTDGLTTTTSYQHPTSFSSSVYRITGSSDYKKYLSQTITVAGAKNDVYSFGGWMRSTSIPRTVQPNGSTGQTYGVKQITVEFLNDSTVVNTATVTFGADTDTWQYACGCAVASGAYTSIRINLCFNYARNRCWYDGIQLYREPFAETYSYDNKGNLTGSKSLLGQENVFSYDSSNNLTSSTDALGNTTSYTYDSKHNLLTVTSPTGNRTTRTYNSMGQVVNTYVGSTTDDTYIGTKELHYSTGLLKSVTDSRGKVTTYTYDGTTRQNTKITDPKGNIATYTYGNAEAMLRLASLTSSGLGTVEYTYDTYGKLTKIKRGSTEYNLTYTSTWKLPYQTKVGSTALSTNAYDSQHRLSTVTYANGFRVRYAYDTLNRVKEIYHRDSTDAEEELTYAFFYNGSGELYEIRNYRTLRASFFEYDQAGRCMASTERAFTVSSSDVVTYGDTLSGYAYRYDDDNRLTKLTCTAAGVKWSTEYTYTANSRPKKTILANDVEITNTYDKLGRPIRREIGLSQTVTTTITYTDGAEEDETTNLVKTYKNGSDSAYSYTYDDNGNISKITQGSTSISYTYDAANRLTRENNQVTNETVTYEYDTWGNILNKKVYAYTTATNLGTPTSTVPYVYGSSAWGDQLTSYDGTTFTYDSMGNPLTYRNGYAFTWRGKQLTAADNGTYSLTYEYNEDGLRQRKTCNSTVTDYYYNGTVLIGMQRGAYKYLFSYDAKGNVVSVRYAGTYYYYLRNAQGDIVKLIDGDGATVVEYTYNSWGKQVSRTGSMADTLGKYQPFRYRGYVYDYETGYYYLQSRYYDPTTGRFISADVLLSTGQGVIGNNAYAYCLDNPVRYHDTQGTEAVEGEQDDPRIVELITENVEEAKKHSIVMKQTIMCTDPYLLRVLYAIQAIKTVREFSWFYSKVSKGSQMDYKDPSRWAAALPDLEFPANDGEEQKYWLNGKKISASDLGNINYGAVGAAMGIPLGILLWQGGAAELRDHQGYEFLASEHVSLVSDYYGDQRDDYESIKFGYTLYMGGYFK